MDKEAFERILRLAEGSAVKHDSHFRNRGMKMDKPRLTVQKAREIREWRGVRKWPR